jgi:hypothetical protein
MFDHDLYNNKTCDTLVIFHIVMDGDGHIRERATHGWNTGIETLLATSDNRLIVASPSATGKTVFANNLVQYKGFTKIDVSGTLDQAVRWIMLNGVGNGLVCDLSCSSVSTLKHLLAAISTNGHIRTRSGNMFDIAPDVPILVLMLPHDLPKLAEMSSSFRVINLSTQ